MELCALAKSAQFPAQDAEFFDSTGRHLVECKCLLPSRLQNYMTLQKERVGGAVHFSNFPSGAESASSESFVYTIHLSQPTVNAGVPKFESPFAGRGKDSETSSSQTALIVDAFGKTPLLVQLAIDSAIMDGKLLGVGTSVFPLPGAVFFQAGSLANLPFYVTYLIFANLQGFCALLAEETYKHLSSALFMAGLSPAVYWGAWFTVLGAKQLLITTIVICFVCFGYFHGVEFLAFALPTWLIALWSIQFSVLLGMFGLKPKTASTAVSLLPAFFSILPTVLAYMPSSQGLSPEVILLLAYVMPSFAYSMILTQLIALTDPEFGGFTFANYSVKTEQTNVSAVEMVVALVVGNILLGLAVLCRFRYNMRGRAERKKTAPLSAQQKGEEAVVSVRG